MNNFRNTVVQIDNTHPIFMTNFSGNPERDHFGSNIRRVNLVIPNEQQAQDLIAMGVNVRQTRPNPNKVYDGEFVPTFFVPVTINLESKWPPKIYWVTPNGQCNECSPEMVGQLDYIRIRNVNCQANMVEKRNKPGEYTLYARIMYVEQDVDLDPYYTRYHQSTHVAQASQPDNADLPF